MTDRTDVLIVGAGPTGMALSIALGQAEIHHMVIDRLSAGLNTSRAAVIHAQTLALLGRLGIADRLVELGVKLANFTIRDRDRALVRLHFDDLPTKHPYLLMLPQDITERVLAARMAELGTAVRRGADATRVVEDGDRVRVTIAENGEEREISARYVVGADGMHSLVRAEAGIDFDGAAYEGSFVLADVRMTWPLGRNEVSLFFSPSGLVVVAPLPDGSFRIVATMDDAPERPGVCDIQALIDSRGPGEMRGTVHTVAWSSRFRLQHRLARSYRTGRLFLMGDAAHVHSPAGGQGMNTGLIDAVVLGELLAAVIKGERPDAALDLYEEIRRPAAEKVLEMAGRLTDMATTRNRLKRLVRNAALSLVNLHPAAKRRLEMNLSGLSRAERSQLPEITRHAEAA
jgi:2-polyprenyl-6-methoxyphenol hydroxylase-like FAD-dependent oxidoreductase